MRALMIVCVVATAGCTSAAAQTTGTGSGGSSSSGSGGVTQQGSGGTTAGTGGVAQSGGGAFVTVQCNKASAATTGTSVVTTYYADVPVTGLNPSSPPNVRAIYCTADETVTPAPTTTTTNSGDPAFSGPSACYEDNVNFVPGHGYVYCGEQIGSTSGTVSETIRFSQVYISM
jgi:hypothetical protein